MERRQRIVARVYGKITYSSMVYAGLVGRVGVVRSKQGLFFFFWVVVHNVNEDVAWETL
jgi:hypothetical protein